MILPFNTAVSFFYKTVWSIVEKILSSSLWIPKSNSIDSGCWISRKKFTMHFGLHVCVSECVCFCLCLFCNLMCFNSEESFRWFVRFLMECVISLKHLANFLGVITYVHTRIHWLTHLSHLHYTEYTHAYTKVLSSIQILTNIVTHIHKHTNTPKHTLVRTKHSFSNHTQEIFIDVNNLIFL